MKRFALVRPTSGTQAARSLAEDPAAQVLAAGIDMLDRMKEHLDEPETLVGLLDVTGLDRIDVVEGGAIHIGARVTLAGLAASPVVKRFLPSLSEAAGSAASPQVRNRATIGGNLGQHTRCGYYRHRSFPCLKRAGNACPVREPGGVQDHAAIFGNATCASASPSSVAPVLGSLDASLRIRTGASVREVAFADAWATPAPGRASDLALEPGDLIEAVVVPGHAAPQRFGYAEVRQKAAFDWALASCGVRLSVTAGKVDEARIWLGSVAPTPLRATSAEAVLSGKPLTEALARAAGEAAVVSATPLPGNGYKLQLTKVVVRRALMQAAGRS